MENTTKPSKSYLQFGLFYGLIMVLVFVIFYALGINPIENKSVGLTQNLLNFLILPLLFIYLGCDSFKKGNNGFASLVECLKVGVSIAFVAALVFAVFNIIFNYAFPEYLDESFRYQRQIMIEQSPNMTSEQVDKGIEMARKFSTPFILLPFLLVMFSFLGLIYSLIIGLIVKKDNPQGF